MKKLSVLIIVVVLLVLVSSITVQAGGGTIWIQRYVLSSGGGYIASGDHTLHSTTGQYAVGLTVADDYALRSGFWFWYQYKVMVPVVMRD